MDKNEPTTPLGELHLDGTVTLTDAGLDVLRAVMVGGVATCEAGIARARDMIRHTGDPVLGRKTLLYYQHAAAFLRHLLGVKVQRRMRMAKALAMLRHPAIMEQDTSVEMPPTPTLSPEEADDESGIPAGARPGSNGQRVAQQATKKGHGRGSGVPGKPGPKRHRPGDSGGGKSAGGAQRE